MGRDDCLLTDSYAGVKVVEARFHSLSMSGTTCFLQPQLQLSVKEWRRCFCLRPSELSLRYAPENA
jgi:hypothetical protein